jgi:hypothetical protein
MRNAEHLKYSAGVGALAAIVDVMADGKPLSLLDLVCAGVGGAAGGAATAGLPDLIEPAVSSHHRGSAHSIAATGGVSSLGIGPIRRMAVSVRAGAPVVGGDRAVRYLVGGVLVGAPAGFVAHNIADAQTPRGIPLLTSGC